MWCNGSHDQEVIQSDHRLIDELRKLDLCGAARPVRIVEQRAGRLVVDDAIFWVFSPSAEMEGVGLQPAVRANLSEDGVVYVEDVVHGTEIDDEVFVRHRVWGRIKPEGVAAHTAAQDVVSAPAAHDVVPGAALEDVESGLAEQPIVSIVTIEVVVVGTAEDLVVTARSEDEVIAAEPPEHLIEPVAAKYVEVRCPVRGPALVSRPGQGKGLPLDAGIAQVGGVLLARIRPRRQEPAVLMGGQCGRDLSFPRAGIDREFITSGRPVCLEATAYGPGAAQVSQTTCGIGPGDNEPAARESGNNRIALETTSPGYRDLGEKEFVAGSKIFALISSSPSALVCSQTTT